MITALTLALLAAVVAGWLVGSAIVAITKLARRACRQEGTY
jgi:hypothetical protein